MINGFTLFYTLLLSLNPQSSIEHMTLLFFPFYTLFTSPCLLQQQQQQQQVQQQQVQQQLFVPCFSSLFLQIKQSVYVHYLFT